MTNHPEEKDKPAEQLPTEQNIFQSQGKEVSTVDLDLLLSKATKHSCVAYQSLFAAEMKNAEDEGVAWKKDYYKLLMAIASFHPNYDIPYNPYIPFFTDPTRNSRGYIPDDLGHNDIDVLIVTLDNLKDHSFRARISDVLWLRTKEYKYMVIATSEFILAAEQQIQENAWVYARDNYHRGIYLATKQGMDKPTFKKTLESLLVATRKSAIDPIRSRCIDYLDLVSKYDDDHALEFATLAQDTAQKISDNGQRQREYYEIAARLFKRAKNEEKAKEMLFLAAEAYVEEAAARTRYQPGAYLSAASILIQGIEAFRRIGAPKEKIEELKKVLAQYQEKSLSEFSPISASTDISEFAEQARKHVEGFSFEDALLRFALGHPIIDVTDLRKQVGDQIKKSPLRFLLSAHHTDAKGRVVANESGIWDEKGNPSEKGMEEKLFSQASSFNWKVRAQAYINPARIQILNEHHPTFHDLVYIIFNNPFVPPGHETIFLRGIHAGIHGDLMTAAMFLVPQIENSIRYVLESHDIDTTNIMDDGTQPSKMLGAIFDIPQMTSIFGEGLCFELKGHLIEKTGYDFRNKIAHGFANDDACYNDAAISTWWLILRILLIPLYQSRCQSR
ncbi:MAG TPA: DUF4209 domain-containing protein [bacterium]|nr:DUF4209 domain-containing protein [bacterium]